MAFNRWLQRMRDLVSGPQPDADALSPIQETDEEALTRQSVRDMVEGILSTLPNEIGCDECFEQMGQFAELKLAGKNAAEALPLVHDHLQRCGDCCEEYEALLVALQTGV